MIKIIHIKGEIIMRVAIVGAGSLGTILGAYISRSGKEVLLVDAYKAHVDALNEKGATVVGEDNFTVPVKACTPDKMEGVFDIVFYLTKAPANEVALTQLKPHLHENSVVCTLQNGIPEEAVASYVGRERTIGGTVGWGASFQGPGVSKLTTKLTTVTSGAFEVGELDGKVTDRIKEVKDVLESMGQTTVLTNLAGARWAKLFLNATYSGLSAALGVPYGGILDDELAFLVSLYTGNEVVKAARLNGVYIIDDFQGNDIKEAEFNNEEERLAAANVFRSVFSPHRLVKASMLNDMERGIFNTEIDQICGAVVEAGRKVGFPTPFSEKIVELVKRAQDKKQVPTFDNLEEFKELVKNAKY
jgi:2-dehydropantoate 2-reductase